jgi:hypothetical protein
MADSGTSLNMLPEQDYVKIFDHFFKDKNCMKLPNTLDACDCTAEEHLAIPDIDFKINGVEYKIPREQWYERNEEHSMCVIKFMHGPGKDAWILGVNFFMNYYTVFDYENKKIGFAPSIKYGHAQGKTFINWVFSDFKKLPATLLNLVGVTEITN